MPAFQAMNTHFLTEGLTTTDHDHVVSAITDAEASYSRFSACNTLSMINASRGEWVSVDDRTHRLLLDLSSAYTQTAGMFDPCLGNTLSKLGYRHSFEAIETAASASDTYMENVTSEHEDAPQETGFLPLEVDPTVARVRLHGSDQLDLGGFAKGWIAQDTANTLLLKGARNGLIDAGGDIILWGHDPSQEFWGIGVANPLQPKQDLASLWFDRLTAIATSSVLKRRWTDANGSARHHIIDPRTHLPASSDLLQVTILSRDLGTAEAFAKSLLILGGAAGLPWISSRRGDLAYIALRNDGILLTSDNLNCYCSHWEVHS